MSEPRYVNVALPRDLAVEFVRNPDSEAPATAVRRLVERRMNRADDAEKPERPRIRRPRKPKKRLKSKDRLRLIQDRAKHLAQESNLEEQV